MSSFAFRVSPLIQSTSKPPYVWQRASRPAEIHVRSYRIPQAYKWAEAFKPKPGRPLLDMSQGVPGIPPPKTLLDALASAASDPASCGYVPNAGEPALRDAIAAEMKKAYGEDADVTLDDVFVTAGCNLAFTAAIMAVAQKGEIGRAHV